MDIILNDSNLNDLPVRTVLRGLPGTGDEDAVAVRTNNGWQLVLAFGRSFPVDHLAGGRYEVLYQPAPPAPKVGDVIDTEEKASRLPVGAVVVDDDPDEEYDASRPAIKVAPGCWTFHGSLTETAVYESDSLFNGMPHRVVHLPGGTR